MNYFQKAKHALVTRATEIYTDMRHDLPREEYGDHFKGMGQIIAQVDSYETLADLTAAVCEGKFDILGLEPSCDESIEEFLKEIFK